MELSATCGCVNARATVPKALPGNAIQIDLSLRPSSIVDVFQQRLTLSFTGSAIRSKDVLLRASVEGDVEVTPRTLQFKEGEASQLLEIRSQAERIRLDSFETMSGALTILETILVSDSAAQLRVTPAISAGQAIEVLRVRYSDLSGDEEVNLVAEVKIGVASQKDHRFIPATVRLSPVKSPGVKRFFLAMSGGYCPDDEENGEAYIRLESGEDVKLSGDLVVLSRLKRRLFEVKVRANTREIPSGAQGIVVRFPERTFLLPFEAEDE